MSGRDIPDINIVHLKTGEAAGALLHAMQAMENVRISPENVQRLQQSLTYVRGIERVITQLREKIERKLQVKH